MINRSQKTAEFLLQINAIKLNITNPFTWASGIKSPIYCDNRKTLSYPKVRNFLKIEFVKLIKSNFADVDIIAGVATGAIAIAALVADELQLPFIYVRSAPKGHGLKNLIEGELPKNKNVVVIEDLVSTGGSSLKAVEAIRNVDCSVLGMISIFTYEFDEAVQNFDKAKCKLLTLSNYSTLLEVALDSNIINKEELSVLMEWRKNNKKLKSI